MTLAETVLAVGLVGMIAVVLIGVFSKLLTSTAKNSDLSVGEHLAKKVLDRAVREGPPNWGTGGLANGQMNIYSRDTANQINYLYTVTPTLVTTPASAYPMGTVYQVTVRVEWWKDSTDSTGSHRDMGRLSTTLGQLVYPNQ